MQPRFLIRRAAAFIIDWVLVSLLVTIFLYPFIKNHTDQIRFSDAAVHWGTCWKQEQAPQELIDLVAPNAIFALTLCAKRPFGMSNGLNAHLTYGDPSQIRQDLKAGEKQTLKARNLVIPVSNQGIPVNPVEPQSILMVFAIIVASAYFLIRKNGKTPGKSVMGLRVVTISRASALRREFWRFAPWIVVAVLSLIPIQPSDLGFLPFNYLARGTSAVITIIILWYYIWPIIRWNGASRYDKIAGTKVICD